MEEAERKEPISLQELKLLLHRPIPNAVPASSSTIPTVGLSRVPWKLIIRKNASENGEAVEESSTKDATVAGTPASEAQPYDDLPPFSYLDLRRKQNENWAVDRLKEGQKEIAKGKFEKADGIYQEGLDLVPDHVDLLVAQAKLWGKHRFRPHAAMTQLQYVLQKIHPNHPQAEAVYQEIKAMHDKRQASTGTTSNNTILPKRQRRHYDVMLESSSAAYQNALMERNLENLENDGAVRDDGYQLVRLSDDEDNRRVKQTKKSKKKKSKRHKKKRRRRKYDSSDSDSNTSVSMDTSSNQSIDQRKESKGDLDKRTSESPGLERPSDDQRSRTRHHHRRHRRHRHDSEDEKSPGGSSMNVPAVATSNSARNETETKKEDGPLSEDSSSVSRPRKSHSRRHSRKQKHRSHRRRKEGRRRSKSHRKTSRERPKEEQDEGSKETEAK